MLRVNGFNVIPLMGDSLREPGDRSGKAMIAMTKSFETADGCRVTESVLLCRSPHNFRIFQYQIRRDVVPMEERTLTHLASGS